jgi:hypothetical protein
MGKRRTPKPKKTWRIKVYGEMRSDIDVHLLTQTVIALGRQLAHHKLPQTPRGDRQRRAAQVWHDCSSVCTSAGLVTGCRAVQRPSA